MNGYNQEPCEISSFRRSGVEFVGLPGIWSNVSGYFWTACTETSVSNSLLTLHNISEIDDVKQKVNAAGHGRLTVRFGKEEY